MIGYRFARNFARDVSSQLFSVVNTGNGSEILLFSDPVCPPPPVSNPKGLLSFYYVNATNHQHLFGQRYYEVLNIPARQVPHEEDQVNDTNDDGFPVFASVCIALTSLIVIESTLFSAE
jgi:hypothetical protein